MRAVRIMVVIRIMVKRRGAFSGAKPFGPADRRRAITPMRALLAFGRDS
jgi:hypothetical protein